jgi:uncharacterized membrane protein
MEQARPKSGSSRAGSLPMVLLVLSGFLLLAGVTLPLAILLETQPSILVYGLVLFSFPVWLVGAILGGVAGWIFMTRPMNSVGMQRIAWALAAINLVAILACLVWQPAGVS